MLTASEDFKSCTFDDITTKNAQLIAAKNLAYQAALQDGGMLIIGESGTEKDMLAAAVHNARNANGPLVEVNCQHLPDVLLEKAMFGDTFGDDGMPILQGCNGGILYLQDVDCLPVVAQSRIVRAAQSRRLITGTHVDDFNCKLIASTGEDLIPMVEDKKFRIDFFEILTHTVIYIPPLRHRKEDVPILVNKYIREFAQSLNKPLNSISDEAMQALTRYRWPSNVAELKATIGRAALLAKGEMLLTQHLPITIQKSRKDKHSEVVDDDLRPLAVVEKRHIQKVLDHTGWHKVRTAQILGIDRSTLYDKIRRYNLVNPADRISDLAY